MEPNGHCCPKYLHIYNLFHKNAYLEQHIQTIIFQKVKTKFEPSITKLITLNNPYNFLYYNNRY